MYQSLPFCIKAFPYVSSVLRKMCLRIVVCMYVFAVQVWSPRLMDALWFGCVPVIISDRYVLPLNNLLNWDDIAYRIPESQVSRYKCMHVCSVALLLSLWSKFPHLFNGNHIVFVWYTLGSYFYHSCFLIRSQRLSLFYKTYQKKNSEESSLTL